MDLETGEGCPFPPDIAAVLRGDVATIEARWTQRDRRLIERDAFRKRILAELRAWDEAAHHRAAKVRHRAL